MSTKKLSKTAKQKKMDRRRLNNRRGIILIALLAATILAVNLIVYSYSWFTPVETTGEGLALDTAKSIRSERCTFETYPGVLVTEGNWETGENSYRSQGYFIDQVAYSNSQIAENDVIVIPRATTTTENNVSVVVPSRVYFRTNIQNEDTAHPSVISLYHHQMLQNVGVAITYPSNTYHRTDEVYDDYFILRNAYVKVKDVADVDGPGLLQVEWFVENYDTTQPREIRVSRQTAQGGSRTQDSSVSWLYHASGGTALATPIEWLYLMYN